MRILKLLIAVLVVAAVTGAGTPVDMLVARLRLDHTALAAAESDYRARRESGLASAEAADYAAYVARLKRRVIQDCVALSRSGEPLPEGLPCPATLPPLTQSAAIDQQAEQTRGEQIATLDAELNAGLGEYDERLLREQERVKAATPLPDEIRSGSGAGSGAGQDEGTGEEGTDANGGDTGADVGEQPPAGTVNRRSGASAGNGTQQAGSRPPPGIPDGSDDDVVARQLREAAEKETDPELKKKLWEEYRKYKQGTR